jgi:hypothetical protein
MKSEPNHRHAVDAGRRLLFAFVRHWSGTTDAGRSANRGFPIDWSIVVG